MNDIDENIRNAFQLVEEVHRFAEGFLSRLGSFIYECSDNDDDNQGYLLTPILGEQTRHTRSLSSPKYRSWAMGQVFCAEKIELEHPVREGLKLPFIFFVFRPKGYDTPSDFTPQIITGTFENIKQGKKPEKKITSRWAFFRTLIHHNYEKFGNESFKIEHDRATYIVNSEVSPISDWIRDSEEEQEKCIEELADNLANKFSF